MGKTGHCFCISYLRVSRSRQCRRFSSWWTPHVGGYVGGVRATFHQVPRFTSCTCRDVFRNDTACSCHPKLAAHKKVETGMSSAPTSSKLAGIVCGGGCIIHNVDRGTLAGMLWRLWEGRHRNPLPVWETEDIAHGFCL